MRNLTIGDLKLALTDLLGDKLASLQHSATGRLYEHRLRAKLTAINAAPTVSGSQTPLAQELAEGDVYHDGFGAAVFHLCNAIEAHPKLTASVKAAAKHARETFVPQLDVLRASFADEAAAALEHRSDIAALKVELKTVSVPGGGTLLDWIKQFVDAGDEIGRLLRQRSKELASQGDGSGTGPLRGATVGLLGRFRSALQDEAEEADSKLPANYDATLFAYIDKLNADRERSLRARGATASSGEDAPPTDATPATPLEAKPSK